MKGVGIRLEVREGATSTSDRVLLLYDSQTRDQLEHKQPRYMTHKTFVIFLSDMDLRHLSPILLIIYDYVGSS